MRKLKAIQGRTQVRYSEELSEKQIDTTKFVHAHAAFKRVAPSTVEESVSSVSSVMINTKKKFKRDAAMYIRWEAVAQSKDAEKITKILNDKNYTGVGELQIKVLGKLRNSNFNHHMEEKGKEITKFQTKPAFSTLYSY